MATLSHKNMVSNKLDLEQHRFLIFDIAKSPLLSMF